MCCLSFYLNALPTNLSFRLTATYKITKDYTAQFTFDVNHGRIRIILGGVFVIPIPVDSVAHSSASVQSRNLNGIDLIKFICAILVFTIHVFPIRDGASATTDLINYVLLRGLCRIAVPFFFVCSGYFLFQKMSIYDLDVNIIKNYCFKILKLLGTWQLLLFFGHKDHLWYLSATVVAVIAVSICFHLRLKFGLMCLLSCVLYCIGLLGDAYYGLFAPLTNISIFKILHLAYIRLFTRTRNGVFMGFIFVFMGASFSQRKIYMKPLTAVTGFLFSMICLAAETLFLKYYNIPGDYNMYVSLLPAVYFLFCFAHEIPLKDHAVYKHLRNIGMWVYLGHMAVCRVGYICMNLLDQLFNTEYLNPVYVFSLTTSIFVAICLEWLASKDKFKWINWLIA